MDHRYSKVQWGPHGERKRTSKNYWNKPRQWNKQSAGFMATHGRNQRVFCASLADIFDNRVPSEWRADLFALISETPGLDWLLLTKRPENMAEMLPSDWGSGWANVWLGVTCEDQDRANHRIPILLTTPAVLHYVSYEPVLELVDFSRWLPIAPRGQGWAPVKCEAAYGEKRPRLNWIIAGGESGRDARPAHPDWFRSVRDQCAAAGVPFFFKQWGEVSNRHSGRLLDGVEHNAIPSSRKEKLDEN